MTQKKNNFWNALPSLFGEGEQIRAEKNRLEAFLGAIPWDYCGFSDAGTVLYSANFCALFGLTQIESVTDIQNALLPQDAAQFESGIQNFKQTTSPFDLTVKTRQGKTIKITGSSGQTIDNTDRLFILWAEDITQAHKKIISRQTALQAAEKELKTLQKVLDSIPLGIWLRDLQGDILWCNTYYAELVGASPAEITIRQIEIPLSLKDKLKSISFRQLAEKALTQKEQQSQTLHIIYKGSRHLFEVRETPLTDSSGTLGMAFNISKQEEIETIMKRHNTANKSLLEQLQSAIAIFDSSQNLEFYNSAYAQLWHLDEHWLNSKPNLGDIMEKLREMRRLPEQIDFKNYKKTRLDMFTNLLEPMEDTLYLPNDTILRMMVMPHPMSGLMMTFEDVTSRLQLESSYNTLIAVQRETLDNLSEGVAVFGSDGRLKLCNPSYLSLWKLHPEDVQGEPHINRLVEKMSTFFAAEIWQEKKSIILSSCIERNEKEGRMARNDQSLLRYASVPLPDGGVLISYYDITDSVAIENALREKNAALEEAEKLKTDFLANVSYQLRTPLSTMMGFAEILDREYFGQMNEKQKEYSSGIQQAGGKLVKLIDDILDLATIEAGYMELSYAPLNIHSLLLKLDELTQEWARKESVSLTINKPADPLNMMGDERRIRQVLLNLLQNAIFYTPSGGSIILSVEETDHHIHFRISDTGVGIPPEDLERITKPFEKLPQDERTENRQDGAGLGLSIVKNIVALHKGILKIESTPNEGTTIEVILPKQNDHF